MGKDLTGTLILAFDDNPGAAAVLQSFVPRVVSLASVELVAELPRAIELLHEDCPALTHALGAMTDMAAELKLAMARLEAGEDRES